MIELILLLVHSLAHQHIHLHKVAARVRFNVTQLRTTSHPLLAPLADSVFNLTMVFNSKQWIDGNYLTFQQVSDLPLFFSLIKGSFGLQIPDLDLIQEVRPGFYYWKQSREMPCKDQFQAVSRLLACSGQPGLKFLLTDDLTSRFYLQTSFNKGRLQFRFQVDVSEQQAVRIPIRPCSSLDKQTVTFHFQNQTHFLPSLRQFSLNKQIISKLRSQSPETRLLLSRRLQDKDLFEGRLVLQGNGSFLMFQRLPKGIVPLLRQAEVSHPSITIVQQNQRLLIKGQPPAHFRVTIPVFKQLMGFQNYQLLGPGGIQWEPLYAQVEGRLILREHIQIRSAEPDFSMPFKVISMVMSIITYNWVNLWRTIQDMETRQKRMKRKD